MKAGTLSKDCKRAVKDCAARSTCGKPGFVTCCRTRATGTTKCSTKSSAALCRPPKKGTACVGQRSSSTPTRSHQATGRVSHSSLRITYSPAKRAYFHSQSLVFVFPSASALYSKTTATAFRRRKFGESL